MFGRRKRQEAVAAEAAREEADRSALFAKLAERPENICPFLGLAGDRAGYIDGVSDDHRCFAFGDPAPLSAEQQTRVCQERGYGNCPRYLRGVLVIPTEELEALRRPRPAGPLPPPPSAKPVEERRRRGASPILLLIAALVLLVGGVGAYVLFGPEDAVSVIPTPTPSPSPTAGVTAEPTASATAAPTATPQPSPTPVSGSGPASPTPEPTPQAGDEFAFYEVSVGPSGYTLYALDGDGDVTATREASFANFSYARAEPLEGSDDRVYWETQEGGLEGWSYRYPDSGEFRVRAVFLNPQDERRSEFLSEDELTEMPEATPAP